jgi:hypothetical protein
VRFVGREGAGMRDRNRKEISYGAANGVESPTLREGREEWGTHGIVSERKNGKGGPPAGSF